MNSTNDTTTTTDPPAQPNACQALEPGDITIFLMNSDVPTLVAMFALENINPEVGSIFMTDNAWTGSELLAEEGTLEVRTIRLIKRSLEYSFYNMTDT